MNLIKKIFGNLHSRIWAIVATALAVILIVLSVTAFCFIPKVFDNLFGGDRASGRGDMLYYETDEGITGKAEAKANGEAVNEKICEEGFVLLKNDGVLPLKTTAAAKKKVSVFGKNSVNLVYGGSGSSGSDSVGAKTIFDSLTDAGYEFNSDLKSFYENNSQSGSGRPGNLAMDAGVPSGFATGETPVGSYSETLKNSFEAYNDLALVVVSRTCGEGNDVPTTMHDGSGTPVTGAASAADHYLELDANEQNMLKMVCENFDKVVLIVNSTQAMELGFLDNIPDGDETMIDYDFAAHIGGAISIGCPGKNGIMALGKILNGSVNPSGRTVDTYSRDFTKLPAYVNFGCSVNGKVTSDSYLVGSAAQEAWFSDYEEGIYVGYRYFETRCASYKGAVSAIGETAYENGEEWYKNNVLYPFGYGLSYTDFSRSVTNKAELNGRELTKDGIVNVTVHVDNIGDYAGKDVVQLYVRAPYTAGGIEKADKTLCAFAKTKTVAKGDGGCDVTLTFDAYDLASYDYGNANRNDFKGYELEKGAYKFFISENAHDDFDSFTMNVTDDIAFENDNSTKYKVENRFADADDQLQTVLSRNNWDGTWPSARTKAEKTVSQSFVSDEIGSTDSGNPLTADSETIKNADLSYATKKDKNGTQLYELIGKDYDDELWDTLLKQLTVSTMNQTFNYAAFGSDAIDYIGKPKTIETDGTAGFVNFMGGGNAVYETCSYASESVVGATWNKELAEEMGVAIGNESIIGFENGDGTPYSGWYAPGINIHRTPFGGRNFDYYSEDGVLNGYLAAGLIKGAWSKGVYTYMKHFVANDSETHRGGVCVWLTEQSLREIYLKPFEIAVKKSDGSARGVMSSFNRVGAKWTGGDYRLLTEVLRNEWGFRGAVICDFKTGSYMNNEQMAYAGGDIYLNNVNADEWVSKNDPVDIYVLKQCLKNYLYVIANSNAMNGLGEGSNYTTSLAYWKIVLIIIDCAVPAGLAVWGVFAVRGALGKKKDAADNG